MYRASNIFTIHQKNDHDDALSILKFKLGGSSAHEGIQSMIFSKLWLVPSDIHGFEASTPYQRSLKIVVRVTGTSYEAEVNLPPDSYETTIVHSLLRKPEINRWVEKMLCRMLRLMEKVLDRTLIKDSLIHFLASPGLSSWR